ncbi:hypothetical protein TUM19329_22620 [Legionella antarctica]|uniref:LidA long coiled-coil domain-containing protein n=1 Tax=Legionella antarctica TaxID=2708020 RepID=A0A6F8T621_9GAMM|nr:hypothetical protein [Legionella antarctica]BCA95901.1 hypothetical protein TUM19329_22620 [Legionella antarctica]
MSKDQNKSIDQNLKNPTATEKSVDLETQNKLVPEKIPVLEKWADLITNNIDNPDQSPTIKISRFGLKNSKDVVAFLRSPAGDSVIAEIGTKLAEEKSLRQYEQLQLREKQLMMNRLKAAFFLWYIEKKAHAADQRREIILDQNEKAIKNSGHTTQPTTPLNPSSDRTSLMRSIADYDRAISTYQNRQDQLLNEHKILNTRLSKLDDQMSMINFKYDLYDTQLNDFDDSLTMLENAPTPDKIAEIQSKIDLIQVQMDEIQNRVNELTNLNLHDETASLMKTHTSLGLEREQYLEVISVDAKIQSQIDSISIEMDEILEQVDELIKLNQDEKAATLMKKHTSMGLNRARHFDMLDVRKGNKHYVTLDGKTELNGQSVSFKDAHFVLNKGQQIIKDGDKHYLLQPGQDWESVKDNQEALKTAQVGFEQTKHELMVVENLVKLNKGLESTFTKTQILEVHSKIKNIETEETLIKNQTGLIQASRASAQNLLDNPNLGLTAPTPTITQGSAKPAPKQTQTSPTLLYKNKLEEFKNSPSVSQADLMNLVTKAPGVHTQAATAYLQTEFGKSFYKNMLRTAPIPHLMMQSLLRNLERFGVDPTKPSVTPIKGPLEKQLEKPLEPESKNESRSQLTPLSTNPFK